MARRPVTAVVDCGKSNVKLVLVSEDRRVVKRLSRATPAAVDSVYPALDAGITERWLIGALAECAADFDIRHIVPTGCGGIAGLVSFAGSGSLVMPMLDYEARPPDRVAAAYAELAPPFEEVFCDLGTASMRFGLQLLWQRTGWPHAVARADALLAQPQYWAWRLSGVAASEATALGAQTHLWNPLARRPSSLVERMGWERLLPPVRPAWEPLGPIRPALAQATGLDPATLVLCGVHDSNGNLGRYLAADRDVTLLSTGTWIIGFNAHLPLEALDRARQMVANTDVTGRPVASSQAMGGREYALIAGDDDPGAATSEQAAWLVAKGVMALPSFSVMPGPFPGSGGKGRIIGEVPPGPGWRAALAALHTALLSHVTLDLFRSRNDIVIDGPFSENPLFLGLLAALRPRQALFAGTEREGTAIGGALLVGWAERTAPVPVDLGAVAPLDLPGLVDYAERWRAAAG